VYKRQLQNPTEVQIAALMLWRGKNREELLATRKVQGLLEDYLVQQVEALPAAERVLAVGMLSCLVTEADTRNIVSREDLVQRVAENEVVAEQAVESALDALVRRTGLVREEYRDRTPFYQIISEFLIPWIRTQKAERERIEAERALVQERIEAEERLGRQQREAEQALALERAQAERRHAQDEKAFLDRQLRRTKRTRAILAVLALMLLTGWGIAARQTWVAQQQTALAQEETAKAETEKERAVAAEEGARSALDQNQRMAESAVRRLQAVAAQFAAAEKELQEIKQRLAASADRPAISGGGLVGQLEQLSQALGEQRQQAISSAIETRQEAAQAKSASGWSLFGKLREDQSWTERNFRREAGGDPMPNPGDIVVAATFVNVRDRVSSYDDELKKWILGNGLGVIAPNQRLRVLEVRRVEGTTDDPLTRYWIRCEPAS
jgi:hypothetical protein